MTATVNDQAATQLADDEACPSWCATPSCRGEHWADFGDGTMATAEAPTSSEQDPELQHVAAYVAVRYSRRDGDSSPGVALSLLGPRFDADAAFQPAEGRRLAAQLLAACDALEGNTVRTGPLNSDGVAYRLAQIAYRAPIHAGGGEAYRLAEELGLKSEVTTYLRLMCAADRAETTLDVLFADLESGDLRDTSAEAVKLWANARLAEAIVNGVER